MTNNGYTVPGSPSAYGEVWASMFRPVNSMHPMDVEDASAILGALVDGARGADVLTVSGVDTSRPEAGLFLALVQLGIEASGMTGDDIQAAHISFNAHVGIDGDAAND